MKTATNLYGLLLDLAILAAVTYLWRVGLLPSNAGVGMLSAIVGARVVVMRAGGAPPAGGSIVLAVLLGLGYYMVGRHHSA